MNTQSAYQRWELASLNGESEHDFRTMPPAIARLAQQMMDAKDESMQQGYAEGYAEGMKQGLAAGEAQALSEGRQQQVKIAEHLNLLLDQYVADLRLAREQVAEDLLRLSYDMAQAIVKHALTQNPDLLIPAIEQALLEIPSLELPATIHLHPDDYELVDKTLGPSLKANGWRLITDHSLEAGGCTINTPSQDIDLRLATRWEKLRAQMGLESPAAEL